MCEQLKGKNHNLEAVTYIQTGIYVFSLIIVLEM